MDIELKISSVFSLAVDDDKKDETENTEDNEPYEYLLPDDDSDEVDILSDLNRTVPNKDTPKLPLTDHQCYTTDRDNRNDLHKSLKNTTSVVEDPDAPPSLLLEGSSSPALSAPSPLIPDIGSMSPPILQREEPLKPDAAARGHTHDKKKKCTKIDPCYIVLTNVDPVMKGKTYISSRLLKRSCTECSNMCKKIQFKRRLKAGKDVFNVKTPSKQKDYLVYLVKAEKERINKGRKKIIQFTQIKEILEKHDLKVAARKKVSGKPTLQRIRRTVSRLPNDFASRPKSPIVLQSDETDYVKKDVSAEEFAHLNKLMIKKHHKVELDSLKKLITIKRSLNLSLKRAKRTRTEGLETFMTADVTSSVSGRVRKANPKYRRDYAVFKRDIEEQRLVDLAHVRLKRAESESKRKVEDLKKDSERYKVGIKRKELSSAEKSDSDQPVAAKMAKLSDVVIDNPEECNVRSFVGNHKSLKKATAGSVCNIEINRAKARKIKERKKKEQKDGVLIQDMPKEENVITGFLQNISFDDRNGKSKTTSSSREADGFIKMEPDDQIGNQYPRIKCLLKESSDKRSHNARQKTSQEVQPQVIMMPVPVSTTSSAAKNLALQQEKYKLLKIPETVQGLFTSKQIKKEPIDEYSITTSTAPVINSSPSLVSYSDKVVTVAYANGVYKKVLLNTSASIQIPPKTKTHTVQAGTSQVPILVNTRDGLRYLVPEKLLQKDKLPSYSEAVKQQCMSSTVRSSTATVTSASSLTLNTNTSVGSKSSAVQALNITRFPVQLKQHQQGQQANVLGVLPSMIQLPVQTAMNSLTQGIPIRPALPTQTQSQTVVHKVFPVPHTIVSQEQSVPIQSDHVDQKPTLPQPTSITNNSGHGVSLTVADGQNQKPLEKCKFYLLKIEGKNVLIPIDGNQAQPKAYVVNSDIITGDTQTQNVNTVTTIPSLSNVSKTLGIRPTILGLPSIVSQQKPTLAVQQKPTLAVQQKPTLAVLPNTKQLNNVLQNKLTAVQNKVSSPQTKSLLQTVTLTNASRATGTTVLSSVKNAVSYSNSKLDKGMKNVIRPSLGNVSIQSVDTTKHILQKKSATTIPPKAVPVYLRQMTSTQASSNLKTIASQHTKSAENIIKNQVYAPPVMTIQTVFDHHNQPVGVLTDVLKGNNSLNDKQSVHIPTKSKTGNDRVVEKREESNTDVGKLCEKSGIFNQKETSDEVVKQSEQKPQAFKEAATEREERLKRLKELLKEKQKAVEEIRGNRISSE